MKSTAKKIDRKYTYEDYRGWPDDERWEIIDGEVFAMVPAPTTKHQRILVRMIAKFNAFFSGHRCELFVAPTDVVLDEYNVVQPDLFVVCDRGKIMEANIRGAPDLIVEILSPHTRIRDKREKKALYERFGVREYIIIHPEDEMVERFRLVGGRYEAPDVFNWDETLTAHAFPEMVIDLWEIFGKKLPETEEPTAS